MASRTPIISLYSSWPFGQPSDLVRDHMQTVLALVVPDHIAQVRHARHNLRRHAPRAAEQPAPAQRHEAPV
jgi:hypothetical protein